MITTPLAVDTRPRHYVRCHDCLLIVVIDVHPNTLRTWNAEARDWNPARCSLCEGRIDYMGAVTGKSRTLTTQHEECQCNELCVVARGPVCTCRCGGEHHGVGLRAGYHVVTTAHGPAPRVQMPDSAKALAVAQTWRDALAAFDLVYRPLADDYRDRVWMAPERFSRFCRLRDQRDHALHMKSQASRLAALRIES